MLKFKKRPVGVLLSCLLISVVAFDSSLGQTRTKDVLDRRIDLSIEHGNLFQICGGLAYDDVPIGLELSIDFDVNAPNNIHLKKGATLREILDSIILQQPNYKWTLQDGVVNLYPIKSRDTILKSLLDIKIRDFASTKEGGRKEIEERIHLATEITMFLLSKDLSRLSISRRMQLTQKDETSDIELSNTDLRNVLNKVVLDSGDSKFWHIARVADGTILLIF